MNNNESIMDVVETTKVEDTAEFTGTNVAPQVINPNNVDMSKFVMPRKTRTIIREYAKKVGRNDPCPCGSGKKYKKCCGVEGKYDNLVELTSEQMSKVKRSVTNLNGIKKAV